MLPSARLLRLALRRTGPVSATLQLRSVHASAVVPARRNRRGSPSGTSSKPAPGFQGSQDDDEEFNKWFEAMQKQYPNTAQLQEDEEELPSTMKLAEDEEDEHDDGEDPDEETEKFLDEAEELFRLNPAEFQKRMETFDQRHAHEDDGGDEDADEIDRATERIPKNKLLKVLGELRPNSAPTGKNAERMLNTNLKNKNMAPLEKKPKQPKAERVTYRQESVGIAVLEFVQNLLVEDADLSGADVIPTIVEANVSPDLRRVVLFWEPVRLNSENQTIGKKKILAVKNRLARQEGWIRRNVTQHLNLKYSPVVQFKQQKEAKDEEARTLFEDEMKWLDRV
ncbi:hypothetical protein PRIC1_002720 [Phytophthora ramorum]|uniref:Ribosome-binding factor A n=1 Tax=Phytophthora ramorum TaxID=164328 RepID=H3GCI5_PHYRM|nr:hypothetical protein KRP23_7444 [Phytophthora ramorum]KAH7509064.1 hypothetical protein KRP22_571 [Phytophthora ramorum]